MQINITYRKHELTIDGEWNGEWEDVAFLLDGHDIRDMLNAETEAAILAQANEVMREWITQEAIQRAEGMRCAS